MPLADDIARARKAASAATWSTTEGGRAGLQLQIGIAEKLAAQAPSAPTPPAPPPSPTPAPVVPFAPLISKWGVHQGGLTDQSALGYDTWLGKTTGIFMAYSDPNDPPWRGAVPGKRSMWSPKWGFTAGEAAVKNFAARLIATGQADAVLRPMWEATGPWMPWCFRNFTPADWIARWRQLVGWVRAVPGGKFTWEWNVNISADAAYNGKPIAAWVEDYWPGDDVVDVAGMDLYSEYPMDVGHHWTTASLGLNWLKDFAARHKKPYGFSEFGVFPGKAEIEFLQAIVPFIKDPACAYAIYFEATDPGLGVNFSLQWRGTTPAGTYLKQAVAA